MLRSVTDLDLWQTHHMYDPLQSLLQHQWGGGDGMPPCFVLILLNNTQFSPGVFGHVCMECKLGLFLLQIRKKLHKWIIVHVIHIWPASTSVIKCAWQFLSGVCISQFCLRITVMLLFIIFTPERAGCEGADVQTWGLQTKKFPWASGPFCAAKHTYPPSVSVLLCVRGMPPCSSTRNHSVKI